LGQRGSGEYLLRNEELNDLYFLPNIVRVIRPKKDETAGHVALTGRGEAYAVFWWGNLRKRDRLVDKGVGGRIILKWIFKQWEGNGRACYCSG
jgi:hypothetical protein